MDSLTGIVILVAIVISVNNTSITSFSNRSPIKNSGSSFGTNSNADSSDSHNSFSSSSTTNNNMIFRFSFRVRWGIW